MTTKGLFNAVEASLKTARTALSEADRYLDMLREEVEVMAVKAKKIEGINMETMFKGIKISTEKGNIEDYLKPIK